MNLTDLISDALECNDSVMLRLWDLSKAFDVVSHNILLGKLKKIWPKFRSYVPEDESLKENVVPAAKPGDVESEVKSQLEAANSKVVIEELDLSNLAPGKRDWELERDVAKKLERLEKRTQRAIAELIRNRLKTGQTNLATSVNIGARATQEDVDED
ncbi:coiled-coil domain-containing protein 12-like [Macrosteles quadrilineatus]|uniref:coiled-coil domain-containing protein 12-like n=1 Tax=Macrosteles quadrilineatus TaxID=74068 RepID=UPI0023E27874|nr:coiled-coil domain-containing protein 12-like [Macrosteles quadrilineatus]